jgi:hypothetical protein
MKKPKVEILSSKSTGAKNSFSVSSRPAGNPLTPNRDYKKKSKANEQKTEISFGQTGLTGRS